MRPASHGWKRANVCVALAGSLLGAFFYTFVDLGGLVSGPAMSWLGRLIAILLWAVPFWVFARHVRGPVGFVAGVGEIALAGAMLVRLFMDEHSTAGLGIFALLLIASALTSVSIVADRIAGAPFAEWRTRLAAVAAPVLVPLLMLLWFIPGSWVALIGVALVHEIHRARRGRHASSHDGRDPTGRRED